MLTPPKSDGLADHNPAFGSLHPVFLFEIKDHGITPPQIFVSTSLKFDPSPYIPLSAADQQARIKDTHPITVSGVSISRIIRIYKLIHD